MSEAQLRKKTIHVRDSLRKCLIKSITATIRDSVIIGLSTEALRSTYKYIWKNTSAPISEGGLALYSHKELQDLIIAPRDSLNQISKEIEKDLKAVTGDNPSVPPSPYYSYFWWQTPAYARPVHIYQRTPFL